VTFPLAVAASEFRAAASQYMPKDMFEYTEHLEQLPEVMLDLAEGLKTMTVLASGQLALETPVVLAIGELYAALRNCIPPAMEIAPIVHQLHEKDLARKYDPRNGAEAESGWNVQ
jgi:hypothetical protein